VALTPEELERLAAGIVSGHEERLVAEMLEQLVTALFRDGDLTVKDLRLLETAAANNRDSLASILARNRGRIRKQTIEDVEAALMASDTGDVEALSSYYRMPAPPGTTALFRRISQETAESVAQIIARQNIRMAAQAGLLWYDVAAGAITEYNHGVKPLNEIVERSVRRLSREGVTTIDYASGVKNSTDVAVRRHVVSQVSQAATRMTLARMEQYDHDLVMVSAHFGARPDHAAWQGKAYSISGTTKGYPHFATSTGYGTITGYAGVNCKHTMGPYFPGISELPKVEEQRNGMTGEEYYEATQKQRDYERSVRQTKRDIDALNAAGADDTLDRLKLGRQQAKLRKHVDEANLVRQSRREKAYGIRSSPRALRKARRA
jgi:hypothetical protein